MNWFKRTFGRFDSKKREVRSKKREDGAVSSYFSHLTSYSKFRLFTPVLLALFTGFLMIHTAAVVSAPVSFSSGVNGQTDWTVENAAATSTLPINPATYTTYTLKTAGLVAGTNIQLQSSSYTALRTSNDGSVDTPSGGSGFNGGTKTNVVVSGVGSAAGLKLANHSWTLDSSTGLDGNLDLTSACTGAGITGTHPNCTITTTAAGFNYGTITIPSGVTLTVAGTNVLKMRATGAVSIGGTINLNASGATAGGGGGAAGGAAQGGAGTGAGPGSVGGGSAGGACGSNSCGSGGGGGGGHSVTGTAGVTGAGGSQYGSIDLATMYGGSGGAGGRNNGNASSGPGGGGGGAIRISTPSTLNVSGTISANGAAGASGSTCGFGCSTGNGAGGSGGGSGGSIHLQGDSVTVTGTVSALAGAGGGGASGGAGGAGAPGRINLDCNTCTGTTNPVDGYVYTSLGTFESATIDLGANTYNLDTLSWNATVPSAANGGGMTIPTTTTGLLNLWEMENVLTDGKGSNTLTNSAAAFDSVTKKLGSYSLSFDATADKVNTGSAIASMSTFSIEGWVKFATASQATGDGYVFDIASDPSVVRNTSNKIIVNIDGVLGITSNATLNNTNWHHIAITANGTYLKLYIDGAYDNQVAWAGTSTAAGLYLGDNNGVEYFTGNIDEVAVYNRALSADEIVARYASLKFQIAASACSGGQTQASGCTTGTWGDTNTPYVGPGAGSGDANTYFFNLPKPKGVWHFNEATSGNVSITANAILDASGNGYHGTFSNANGSVSPTTAYAGGKLNGAITFDGTDDAVTTAAATALTAADNWTLAVWVYYNGTGGGVNGARVFYNGNAGARGYGITRGFASSDTNVISVMYGGINWYSTGVAYDVNTWNHIVAVRSAGVLTVYKNGSPIAGDLDGAASPVAPTSADNVEFGGGSGASWGGLIDEAAVYNTALSAQEIALLYKDGAGRETPWAIPSGLNTPPLKQYVRYKAYLSTADPLYTPQVDDLTISYSGYPALASLTSSKFDTGATNSFIKEIKWVPTNTTAGKRVEFQVSAADAAANLGTFYGPDGTANTSFTTNTGGVTVNTAQIPGKWFQYKAILTSDGTTPSPVVDNIDVVYDTVSFKFTSTGGGSVGAGTAYPITIEAVDGQATPARVTAYTGSKLIAFSGAANSPGGTTPKISADATCDAGDMAFNNATINFNAGLADPPGAPTDYYLCLYKAEAATISTTGAIPASTPLNVTVNGTTTVTSFSLNAPVDITAGGARAAYTLTRLDQYGNPTLGSGSQVVYLYTTSAGANAKFDDAATGTTYITSIAIPNGQSSVNFWYYDEKAGSYTITASDNSISPDAGLGIVDATDALTVNPEATSLFTLNAPADIQAGNRAAYTVTRYDMFNNLVTSGAQTVYLYTNSGGAGKAFYNVSTNGTPVTSVSISNGASTANFWYYDELTGSFTVTASDATPSADALVGIDDASDALGVTPAAANKVVFATQPSSSVMAGVNLAQQPVVQVQDAFGNLRSGDSSLNPVTLSAVLSSDGTTAGGGTLTATANPKNEVNGVAAFAGVNYTKAESIKLKAVSGALTPALSNAITVSPAAAASFVVAGITDPVAAGTASNVTVTVKDAYNNTVTGYTGAVAFTSNDAQAVLPANYTFLAGDLGVKTFTGGVTMKTSGERTVTVTDVAADGLGVDGITGTQSAITVNPAAAVNFAVSGISDPVTAGTASNVTVTARDTYGNTVTGYTGAVAFTSNDAQAVLPANYTFLAGDLGVKTFTGGVTMKTSGERTVTATDVAADGLGVDGITGTQSAITVNPAATSLFTLNAPADMTAGGTRAAYTATRYDAFNNLVTNGAQNVYLYSTSTGPNKAFYNVSTGGTPVASVSIADGQSAANFWYYDELTGSFTITASDATPSANGATGIIDATDTLGVTAAGAAAFFLNAPADIATGTEATYTVTRKDAFGNLFTSGPQTVYLTSNSTGSKEFRATSGGSPVSSISIANGQSAATFYYYDNMPGSGWSITASDAVTPDGATGIADAIDTLGVTGIKITTPVAPPSAPTVWGAGTADQQIIWAAYPASRKIEIHYYNGSSWQMVFDGATAASYASKASPQLWDVPGLATISSAYKIRIVDAGTNNTWQTSLTDNIAQGDDLVVESSTFSVSGGITLTAPTGGQKWAIGTAHNITWIKSGTFNTKVEYSTNGSTWNAVTGGGADNSGITVETLPWTPSSNLTTGIGTTTLKIRVSDASTSNPPASSVSATDVTISSLKIGSLTGLTSGRIAVGGALTIPWTAVGVTNVKLEYYSNTSGSYQPIAGAGALAVGSSPFVWTVPDDVGVNNVLIRATAVNAAGAQDPAIEGLVQDTTTTPFTIFGSLSVVSPNGGEQSSSTSPLSISFTGSSSIDAIKFYYKTSGAGSYTQILSNLTYSYIGGTGSASWTPGFSASQVWIKVEDNADSAVFDESNNFFILNGVGLNATVTSNSPYSVGSVAAIAGTAVVGAPNQVKLEYSTTGSGGTYATLGTGAANVAVAGGAFSYNWTVPNAIGTNIYIKVTDLASSASATAGPITINAGFSSVAVSAPANASFYEVGEATTISWTTAGTVGLVKLEYYTGIYAAATAPDIVASTSNLGTYSWTVPDYVNTGVKVRVSDADTGHPAAFGESSAFNIKGKLTITTPGPWFAGDGQDVTWTVKGDIGNVRIRYASSKDNGVLDPWNAWTDVIAATPSQWATGSGVAAQTRSYTWAGIADIVLAEALSAAAAQADPDVYMKIRIEDADDTLNVYAETTGFIVKYHTITWKVVDVNGTPITSLCVQEPATTNPTKDLWTIGTPASCSAGTFSGNNTVRYYPDNSVVGKDAYTTIFNRLEGSSDYTASQSGWIADIDKTITVTMDTAATATLNFETQINAVYNATNDSIDISSWLTKKGVLVNDVNLGAISVNVYDANGTLLNTGGDLGAAKTVNAQGIYGGISYDPTAGLDPSLTYTIKATITYNNKPYTSISGFVSPSVFAYEAKIGAIYNTTNDSIMANIWLERSGTTVLDPGDMTFKVLDNAGTQLTSQAFDGYDSTTDTVKDAKLLGGVYTNIEFDPAAGLSSTQIYTIKGDIVYRGRTYNAVASFSKGELGTISSNIASVQATQASQTATLAALPTSVSNTVTTNMTSQLAGQTTTLQGTMATNTASLTSQIGTVSTNVTALPTTVSAAAQSAVTTEMAKGIQAELLTRPADVATGSTVPIRFRTASGLAPKITVYDPNGTARVSAAAMKEISTTGIYEYKLTLDTAWGTGDFTVLVTESTKGSTDSLILHVGQGGLDEIYAKVTTGTSSSAGVSLDTIYSGVSTIQTNTTGLNNDITALLTRLGKSTDSEAANTVFGKIAAIDASSGNEEAILAGVDEVKNYVDTLESSLGSSGDAMSAETIFGRLAEMEDMMKNLGASSKEVEAAKAKANGLAKLMEEIRADLANGNMAEASAKLAALGQGLTSLNNDLSGLPATAGAASVGNAFEDLKTMAAEGGLEALVPLLEEIKAGREAFNPENMGNMRNTIEELKSLMTEVRSLLDQEVNKPVVHGWLEEEQE